nr:hypothetical protein [Ancylobacter sp. Lp-2]
MTFPHHAYVLALSVGAVRLIEVTADLPPRVVSVPGLPRDAASALGRSTHLDKDGPGRSGEETSEHALLLRYARAVDHALRPLLKGESAPLIVAATEPMASIYRSASSYPYVAEQVLAGNADHITDAVLAAEARKVLDQIYAQEIAALKELFEARAVQGRATADIAQAARAATFGAVDTLIVDMDVTVSGHVDADGKVAFDATPDAANYGIGDEIVRRVLQAGGRVIAARRDDVPLSADVAAILRYPL